MQSIGGLMALTVNAIRLTRSQAIAKRVFDVVVSALGRCCSASSAWGCSAAGSPC
jgi:hypothetical protein